MEQIRFLDWTRSRILAEASAEQGRLKGRVKFTLTEGGASLAEAATIFFKTAGDVSALRSGAIRHLAPKPFTADAETTKLVHVDFTEPDLPWRYTPRPADAGRLRPWLVLLVGTPDELQVEGALVRRLEGPVLQAHDLALSDRWAHVQLDRDVRIARLLSPAKLLPQREYVAAIVPAFNPAGDDSWSGGDLRYDELPAFFSWGFRTGEEGDFETLATALRLHDAGNLGVAKLRYRRPVAGVDVELTLGGAITSLKEHPSEPDAVRAAREDLDLLNDPIPDEPPPDVDPPPPTRDIIQLPEYGGLWLDEPDAAQWGKSMNDDARHRGVGGLGLWLGVVEQESLMDAAVKQAGALQEASQRIGDLAFGLDVAARLWRRRLPQSPELQLRVFGPAMGRMPADGGGTVLDRVTSETSVLDAALFSSAAQRLLRNGSARGRFAAEGRIDRRAALAIANEEPERSEKTPAGLPHVDKVTGQPLEDALGLPTLDGGRLEPILAEFDGRPNQDEVVNEFIDRVDREFDVGCVEAIQGYFQELRPAPVFLDREILFGAIDSCFSLRLPEGVGSESGLGSGLPRPERPDDRRPIRLPGLAGAVAGAIDPTQAEPPARRRVGSTIIGIELAGLAPPEAPIGLDFPTWALVSRHAREWLLPGVGTIPPNSIVSLRTNPTFVDAFMLGINTQFLAEMRWRNLPAPRVSTPLRMFWGYANHKSGGREPDIRPVADWPSKPSGEAGADDVGDLTHQAVRPTDRTGRQGLVIAFRTALFRRYPSTLVYLVRPESDAQLDDLLKAPPNFGEPVAPEDRHYLGPIFFGQIEPDLVFFAFDVDPSVLDKYWLVLDEPPSELRFRNDKGLNWPGAAEFAKSTIDTPTRVAISGAELERQASVG